MSDDQKQRYIELSRQEQEKNSSISEMNRAQQGSGKESEYDVYPPEKQGLGWWVMGRSMKLGEENSSILKHDGDMMMMNESNMEGPHYESSN